jgi:hypothetical protein
MGYAGGFSQRNLSKNFACTALSQEWLQEVKMTLPLESPFM